MAKNVSDPKESSEAVRAAYKLIVAVDIETTYTKVAWSQTKRAEAHLFLGRLFLYILFSVLGNCMASCSWSVDLWSIRF